MSSILVCVLQERNREETLVVYLEYKKIENNDDFLLPFPTLVGVVIEIIMIERESNTNLVMSNLLQLFYFLHVFSL